MESTTYKLLRQDGCVVDTVWPISDTSDVNYFSEAAIAAILTSTHSKDIALSEYVLDVWMASLVEQVIAFDADYASILKCISKELSKYPQLLKILPEDKWISIHIKNCAYTDVDTLYEFLDHARDLYDVWSQDLHYSWGQQFCTVKCENYQNEIFAEFQLRSVSFNWTSTIRKFARSDPRIRFVSVCRDVPFDRWVRQSTDFICWCKASTGADFRDVPVSRLSKVSLLQPARIEGGNFRADLISQIQEKLQEGYTLIEARDYLNSKGVSYTSIIGPYFLSKEYRTCVVSSSDSDVVPVRTYSKFIKVVHIIRQKFSTIDDLVVDTVRCENSVGKLVGVEVVFEIFSRDERINHLHISVSFAKSLESVTADIIARRFRLEYLKYLERGSSL